MKCIALCSLFSLLELGALHGQARDSAGLRIAPYARAIVPQNTGARLPFRIAGQIGMGAPVNARRCTPQAYLLPGLELQSRGSIFVTARAEGVLPLGPVASCLMIPRGDTLSDGRILVRGHEQFEFEDAGYHFALGAGASLPMRVVTGEAKINLGLARGQADFPSEWLPSASASIGIVTLRNHLVFSFDQRWFRVPRWEKTFTAGELTEGPPTSRPAGSTTQRGWQGFRAFLIGFRY